ncbi:MAG: NAD(P)-binding protein [Pseudomonadota bacterium]
MHIETDYLIVGAGAVGLAFADTLLDEDPGCHITIVDKHARPGGHWNDAYSFVALHQPSATYGVNSMEMCPDRVDTSGHNNGMYPLAKHAEILAYYGELMTESFIPSGRVEYLALTEYLGGEDGKHMARSILSGEEQTIFVNRKLVDGTWFQTSVPSTHTPSFSIAEGMRFAVPGDLPQLWLQAAELPNHYCVIGGGKTAMDTVVWLLEAGVAQERIDWVRPRDSWMFNRKFLQPAQHRLDDLAKFQIGLTECAKEASDGDEFFAKAEDLELMLRIDREVTPKMFHFAVISEAEVELLRTVTLVHRNDRVTALEPSAMMFGERRVDLPEGTLFVNCTASAVRFEDRADKRPFFDGDTITVQLVQAPLVPYSAALAAFVEANFDNDEEKNALMPLCPQTDSTATYPYALMANMMSNAILAANDKVSAWNAKSRLHPIGPAIAKMRAENDPRLAQLADARAEIQENMPHVIRLGMAARAIHEGAAG